MSDFNADKNQLLEELSESRAQLNEVIGRLTAEDFDLARRGSWPVSKILEHVLHAERLYAQLISMFSGVASTVGPGAPPASPGEALAALGATRKAVLDSLEHVQEGDFYRLQRVGHEEYSVLSILENVASHDREHAEQIRKTAAP